MVGESSHWRIQKKTMKDMKKKTRSMVLQLVLQEVEEQFVHRFLDKKCSEPPRKKHKSGYEN